MKSKEIHYLGATFWAMSRDLENSKCREFTLFEDKELMSPAISIEQDIMMIQKLSPAEAINEAGAGSGFATWGGGGGFGNPSMGRSFYGRGFGFGSNAGSGSNSMYTYDIKPLNQTLEPPGSNADDGQRQIHVGSVVKGKILGKKKHITGQIQSIEQDGNNNIKYYVVRDPDTAKAHKIDPTAIFIWAPENEGPHPGAADVLSSSGIKENFYPRLKEELSASEALFGFAGWLTSRDKKTVMSSKADASNIAKKVGAFCDANDLADPVDEINGIEPKENGYSWSKELKYPDEEDLKEQFYPILSEVMGFEQGGDAYKKIGIGKYANGYQMAYDKALELYRISLTGNKYDRERTEFQSYKVYNYLDKETDIDKEQHTESIEAGIEDAYQDFRKELMNKKLNWYSYLFLNGGVIGYVNQGYELIVSKTGSYSKFSYYGERNPERAEADRQISKWISGFKKLIKAVDSTNLSPEKKLHEIRDNYRKINLVTLGKSKEYTLVQDYNDGWVVHHNGRREYTY